jgi:hypothetical protein
MSFSAASRRPADECNAITRSPAPVIVIGRWRGSDLAKGRCARFRTACPDRGRLRLTTPEFRPRGRAAPRRTHSPYGRDQPRRRAFDQSGRGGQAPVLEPRAATELIQELAITVEYKRNRRRRHQLSLRRRTLPASHQSASGSPRSRHHSTVSAAFSQAEPLDPQKLHSFCAERL